MKKPNKWEAIIGCLANFNDKGILQIYQNAKVERMSRIKNYQVVPDYRILAAGRFKLLISSDGLTMAEVKKKYCKII